MDLQIKCYMQQLFRGLEHCHSRGVLHRDIKGSNILIDNNGVLKIADFGLATFYDKNQPMTSRVVTLWYRAPELLLGSTEYGPAIDQWSAGCILAELFAGKPIMPGRTEVSLVLLFKTSCFLWKIIVTFFDISWLSILYLFIFLGGTNAQDFQTLRFTFRGLLAENKITSCNKLQTPTTLQALCCRDIQRLPSFCFGSRG